MNRYMLCEEVLANISDYVDGDLAKDLCAKIELHMGECNNCRVVVDTMRRTVEIVQLSDEGEDLPTDIHQRLLARLQLPDPDQKP